MSKSDTKFQNASIKMNEALFKLLEEKDFSEISVSQLCEKAKVNRSTFYAHYNNTFDLLQEARNNFVKEFFENFSKNIQNINYKEMQAEIFVSNLFLVPYLEFIKKNKRMFKIFIQNLNSLQADEFYNLLLEKLWYPICKQKGITDKAIISYMSLFFLNGITSIVMNWIKNNCEDDILFLCEIIILCIRPSQDDPKVNLESTVGNFKKLKK